MPIVGSFGCLELCLYGIRELASATSRSNQSEQSLDISLTRDLGGCVFTFISSILVYNEVLTEKFSAYIDPVIALIYIIFFISSCVNITKDSCLILLQTIPGNYRRFYKLKSSISKTAGNVDISLLKTFLLKKFPGILSLHEFHTWTFTPGTLVCTGHITYQAKPHHQNRPEMVNKT